ncbi:hypothetical protein PbJCM13498_12300 [Prolixibacter bellariivorans]|uniref:Nucleoside 2-deoxyribosyltransferase n=1 Tax=Prolixibacter bellariivorans TaxID=314319 RepID=A0A5M4AY47_9BACT|nr:hypothetical protein [Prolixibacter bellariivorans]GET32367.1 hypothetical protein PbJCM13498_12300 [Prolixibacter bellariivorans]
MGNYSPKQCYITDLDTENFPSSYDLVEYLITINGKRVLFRFLWEHRNSEFVEANKHILYGLLLNDKFPKEYSDVNGPILDNETLEKIINESPVPKSPPEKLNNLLTYLHSLQEYEGAYIQFPKDEELVVLAKKLYFKNYNEMSFYLFTLLQQNYIEGRASISKVGRKLNNIKLTYEGLARVVELAESGEQSDRCFVAMSFSKDLNKTRHAIKTAINLAGFTPILIDELHFDADVTINDAIISEIKKCKFLVADFTQHKHGVYFEAGFALGLARPVIYLCHKDDFSKTHFDTNHYPHIIYQDLADLTEKLKTKIEAWIKQPVFN